jgi:hypothetical protein
MSPSAGPGRIAGCNLAVVRTNTQRRQRRVADAVAEGEQLPDESLLLAARRLAPLHRQLAHLMRAHAAKRRNGVTNGVADEMMYGMRAGERAARARAGLTRATLPSYPRKQKHRRPPRHGNKSDLLPNIQQQVDDPSGIRHICRPPAGPGLADTPHPVGAIYTPARVQLRVSLRHVCTESRASQRRQAETTQQPEQQSATP